MPLPPLMPNYDQTRIRFQRGDEDRPDLRHSEPGTWWNNRRGDLVSFIFPEQKQVVDLLLGGDDPTTVAGDFVLTVYPVKTQTGTAGSDGLGPASIALKAQPINTALADAVGDLIDLAEDGAELLTPNDLNDWNQLIRLVKLEVGGTPETLRVSALNTGSTFIVTLTAPSGVTVTQTIVSSPDTSTIKVGFYAAINRAKGTNGYNKQGQAYIKEIDPTTPREDIVGPIYLGNETEAVEAGFAYREYKPARDISGVLYGEPLAYGELIVPTSAIGSRVYARHTNGSDFLRGMAADRATAELGATAVVLTLTPVGANATLYEFDVFVAGTKIGTVSYTSSGAATADEIAAQYRSQLLAIATAYQSKIGVAPYTLNAANGSPVVLTGAADGANVVLTPTANNVGNNGIVITTPAVSTHHLVVRGDRFLAESLRIGSVPVSVQHP